MSRPSASFVRLERNTPAMASKSLHEVALSAPNAVSKFSLLHRGSASTILHATDFLASTPFYSIAMALDEANVATAALVIAISAFVIACGQPLQQLFATADGLRRCQPSVIGDCEWFISLVDADAKKL